MKQIIKLSIIIIALLTILLYPAVSKKFCAVKASEVSYDFSDEAQLNFEKEDSVLRGNVSELVKQSKKNKKKDLIKKGTSFNIILQSSLNTKSLNKNDTIAGTLEDDLYCNDNLIAPSGSIIYGKILKTKKAGALYGDGRLTIRFDELMLPDGQIIKLNLNKIKIRMQGNRLVKSTVNVLGGTVLGAAMGVPLYIPGVGIGGIIGMCAAISRHGEDVELPAGTIINLRIVKNTKITV